MPRVILNAEMLAKLLGLAEVVELCDEEGQVVGFAVSKKFFYDILPVPEITTEEVEELRRNPSGRPLKEILEDLERKYGTGGSPATE